MDDRHNVYASGNATYKKRGGAGEMVEDKAKRLKTEDGSSSKCAIDCDDIEDDTGDIAKVTGVQVREGQVR